MKATKSKLLKMTASICLLTIMILFLLWPQLIKQQLIVGVDAIFHFNRFYDTMMQIKTNNYNYFLTNFGFNQTGRIVNALYGPIMAYLQGGILLLSGSWLRYQIGSNILLITLSFCSMFVLATKLKFNFGLKILLASLYATSPAVVVWITSQQFTGWGAAVLPLLFAGGLAFYDDHLSFQTSLALAVPMALLLQIHTLSALIGTIGLIPLMLTAVITNKGKSTVMFYGFLAILITLLLSGNVWAAMLDILPHNHLLTPWPYQNMADFTNSFTLGLPDTTNFAFTHGLIYWLLIISQLILGGLNWRNASAITKALLITILLFTIIPSSFLPWDLISNAIPSLRVLLQFPRRLNVIAEVLTPVLLGLNITEINWLKRHYWATVGIVGIWALASLFSAGKIIANQARVWDTDQVLAYSHNVTFTKSKSATKIALQSANLSAGLKAIKKNSVDYLPTTKTVNYTGKSLQFAYPKYWNLVKYQPGISKIVTNGTLNLKVKPITPTTINLPVVIYQNSQLIINQQHLKKTDLVLNSLNQPIIKKERSSLNIQLKYRSSVLFKLAASISSISWLIMIGYWLMRLITHFFE